jgi:hypothetical protein
MCIVADATDAVHDHFARTGTTGVAALKISGQFAVVDEGCGPIIATLQTSASAFNLRG